MQCVLNLCKIVGGVGGADIHSIFAHVQSVIQARVQSKWRQQLRMYMYVWLCVEDTMWTSPVSNRYVLISEVL